MGGHRVPPLLKIRDLKKEGHLDRQSPYGFQCRYYPGIRCPASRLYVLGPKLTPRDPALQVSMNQVSPVITKQTTMWRGFVGFNASHSMGLILFGLIYSFLAISNSPLLFRSPVPTHCRVSNAWWPACAQQSVLVQEPVYRCRYFTRLLCRQHSGLAS